MPRVAAQNETNDRNPIGDSRILAWMSSGACWQYNHYLFKKLLLKMKKEKKDSDLDAIYGNLQDSEFNWLGRG